MTNREKYNFDCFTIENYQYLVKTVKERGYEFILHKDKFILDRKDIIWRHDVEFSPDIALQMAKIENKLGVQATYFFQIHSEFYNVFEKYTTDILQEIRNLGHHIGLHFDSHFYGISDEASLNRYIELDKNYLNAVMKLEIDTFSFHNTTPFVLSCKEYQYGGLINVYSDYFKKHYQYRADSTGYWRYENFFEEIKTTDIQHFQFLTHDAMWSNKVLSPRQRVRTSIQANADRIKAQYDQILIEFHAQNIDD